jgi:L-seryl-tRNA(Ser) seleniumtransferase
MMSLTLDQVKVRAEAWQEALGAGEVVISESTVGGGSLPEEAIPTHVLALKVKSPEKFLKRLREANPPIVARIVEDTVLFDPRTVLDDESFMAVLKEVFVAYR